jgi:hypothetical protein
MVKTGTDLMIFKIFSAKIQLLIFAKIIITLVFEKAPIFSPKIGKICDHYIDLWLWQVIF